ncbi:antibiotic biosynthesis monooxygenase family protein [Wenjunlia tyrosinilytica]|uniref:Antibiotic biosynthesis monooxygenase n=1 Tax=Wenjunlia tyrosinilytica TaxID=1544741 RepID=A0A917ZWI4_9ACTN|nr:antibiotic biosynthesis monooxygenase family protein [Wenjunlia tyrosinilytica]GGO95533.1 antibiotic biosynthesis monooxygenase [Wenjunlia tyrosinilytica]
MQPSAEERPQPYRVQLRMEILPGREREFEEVWRATTDVVAGHEANLGQALLRADDDPGVYYIVSDWRDEAGFRDFEHSDAHIEHRSKLHPYRSAGSFVTMILLQATERLSAAGPFPAPTRSGRPPL